MNNKASITAKAGINLLILLLIFRLITLPKTAVASITGNVPKPNNAIYAVPDKKSPVERDPAIPTYTKPQGSSPFNSPIENKDEFEFFEINFENPDLIAKVVFL